MNRKAVVLLLGSEEGTGRGPGAGRPFETILGRPAGAYALEAACRLDPEAVLVLTGAGGERFRETWEELIKSVATRTPVLLFAGPPRPAVRPLNALAALLTARTLLEKYPDRDILVVPSGLPLLQARTLKAFLRAHASKGSSLTFMSRGEDGGLSGVLALRSADAFPLLGGLPATRGMSGFEALTRRLAKAGKAVGLFECPAAEDTLPLRTAADLSRATAVLRRRKNAALLSKGVTLLDPASAWIDWAVEIGPRAVIYPGVVIEGETRIGADARVYPHVHIVRSRLGARAKVLSSTVMEDCEVEPDTQVGPFSRLRPKTRVCAGAKVGNFVEMKNTVFGPRSKAQHLSYLGDSRVEEDVNVGAGTITCNFDGVSKNPTRIGAGAFIGSGTELVAPVEVGRGAYVAAGSTITKNVSAGALAIARARQVEKPGWVLEKARRRKQDSGGRHP